MKLVSIELDIQNRKKSSAKKFFLNNEIVLRIEPKFLSYRNLL